MKFFLRSQGDTNAMFALNRCHFEAELGRASTAVQRVCDLAQEIPGNAHVLYEEGVLRRDFLGQGIAAMACFRKAYEAAVSTNNGGQTAWLAASNAGGLALNAEVHRYWVELAIRHCPTNQEDEIRHRRLWIAALDQGANYLALLLEHSRDADEHDEPGCASAILEVLLKCEGLTQDQAQGLHKDRATRLRALDVKDEKKRNARGELSPPDERLALQEALRELDAALAIDEFDATLWNYRAAWCGMLSRHEEAIVAAERAIAIRPHLYARPHVNKAFSLYHLQRYEEARKSIEVALQHAISEGSEEQIGQARFLCQKYQTPPSALTLEVQIPAIQEFLQRVQLTAREELEQVAKGWNMSPGAVMDMLVRQILLRESTADAQPAKACVPIIAQLLSDFTADTAFGVMCMVGARNPNAGDHCFAAILYLAAHSEGLQQRDTARLLALMILCPQDAQQMRQFYRQQILETAAADSQFLVLDSLVRDALGRISPDLPDLLADQEPVTPEGRARAAHDLRVLFSGDPPQPIYSQGGGQAGAGPGRNNPLGPGCGVCLTLIIGLIIFLLTGVWLRV